MATINITDVRSLENDYANFSNIVSSMQDYVYNNLSLNDNEVKTFVKALASFERIQNRMLMDARQTAVKYFRLNFRN
jgi:hypothetical protein